VVGRREFVTIVPTRSSCRWQVWRIGVHEFITLVRKACKEVLRIRTQEFDILCAAQSPAVDDPSVFVNSDGAFGGLFMPQNRATPEEWLDVNTVRRHDVDDLLEAATFPSWESHNAKYRHR
jgi:hypothetical protein